MNEELIKYFWLIIGIVWVCYGIFGSFKNPGLRFMARIGMIIVGIEVIMRHFN